MRRCREFYWRDGGHCAGGLSLRPVLARIPRDSVLSAGFAGGGGTHDGRVVGRGAGREARLGAFLSADDGRDDSSAVVAALDRAARYRACYIDNKLRRIAFGARAIFTLCASASDRFSGCP